jgi:hypothetical protein
MVTMNQLYLVKGGPGIIALHSFLYLQLCRVTAFGISLCRYKSPICRYCSMFGISLTNLLLLPYIGVIL